MTTKHHAKTTHKGDFKYPDAVKATAVSSAVPPPASNQFKGETVTVQRDAQAGDAGFVEGSDQVLVIFEDNTTRIVRRSEIS